jgi:hypothetical protein
VRRYLPRELRIKLYSDVVALRRDGLTYGGIVEEVARCLTKVLGRRQIRPRYRDDVEKYVVEFG